MYKRAGNMRKLEEKDQVHITLSLESQGNSVQRGNGTRAAVTCND